MTIISQICFERSISCLNRIIYLTYAAQSITLMYYRCSNRHYSLSRFGSINYTFRCKLIAAKLHDIPLPETTKKLGTSLSQEKDPVWRTYKDALFSIQRSQKIRPAECDDRYFSHDLLRRCCEPSRWILI